MINRSYLLLEIYKEYNTKLILKTRQRNEILTIEINKALQRIENGSYATVKKQDM
ncbi:hypothetical protein [Ehrlichia ruminantium]|uniref:hypothetical protein n=1 Tax=Ehrlichia ruminantium TaxID=779 RepID=UPI000316C4B8|nr:hypothetical protein [Ehrlichia ruminantium]